MSYDENPNGDFGIRFSGFDEEDEEEEDDDDGDEYFCSHHATFMRSRFREIFFELFSDPDFDIDIRDEHCSIYSRSYSPSNSSGDKRYYRSMNRERFGKVFQV